LLPPYKLHPIKISKEASEMLSFFELEEYIIL
jgi:hypothetical protein